MKKLGLTAFIVALAIGLTFSINCSFRGLNSMTDVQGSGISKTETRSVSGFKKVDAGGAINVEIAVQKDFSVTVRG